MQNSKDEMNSLWESELEANSKNTRTAFAVLGVVIALVIALIVALLLYLPTVISYSMDSFDFSLPEFSLSDLLEELRKPEIVSVQTEPAPEPAMRLEDGDLGFLNVFAAYVIELSYAPDAEMQKEIHQMFYPELEYLCGEKYRCEQLLDFAWYVLELNYILSNPSDHIDFLVAQRELSTVVLTVQEGFYFLSDYPDILDYYANIQWYTEAMLEAEYSLQFQLTGASTEYSREHGCQVVYYTNDTPYTIDVKITNDFVTDTEHYSSEYIISGLQYGETEEIPLPDLEEIGDRDHTWTLNWEVLQLYLDGIPIEDYYQ